MLHSNTFIYHYISVFTLICEVFNLGCIHQLIGITITNGKKVLHLACWNINGFKVKGFNKYSHPEFINEISNNDVVPGSS